MIAAFAATLAALAAGSAGPAPERPVVAEVEHARGTVHVRLVGAATRRVGVRYELTSGGAGNRAMQSGSATLEPRHRTLLLSIAQNDAPDWHGTLHVDLDDGTGYALDLPHRPAATR